VKKIDKELLEKFSNSECSELEREIVISWFVENQYDISLKSSVKSQFYELLENDESELNFSEIKTLLDKVHHKINVRRFNGNGTKQRERLFIRLSKVAAILFFPLLIATLILSINYLQKPTDGFVEIVTPPAARIHFTLPDGSSGWLNSESVLRYSAGLHGKARRVELIGEGFFNVEKNPNRPFIVKSNNIEVKVLGTKFNVNAYPEESEIEVALQSGKVEVYGISDSNVKSRIAKLLPGEQVSVSKTNINNITKTKIEDTEFITAWIDDILVFRGETMESVVKKISRWFNVDVKLEGDNLKDYKLHATFHQESLDEILKLIKLTSPIDYKVIKRERLPDGTYTKESIIFFKKK
jgi:ferric-dicitrate binding protein FerR (iron transport regulator)